MAGFWDSLRSAFAGASAGRRRAPRRKAAPPVPKSRARQRARYGPEGKVGTRSREQLLDRMDRGAPFVPQRVTRRSGRFTDEAVTPYRRTRQGAVMGHGMFTGNYPARGNLRDVGAQLEGTRSQLAQRRATRAAQGYAATQPHPRSGEGARSPVRGVGRARRPAVGLPNYPPVVPAGSRQPRATGAQFAGATDRKRRAG